MVSSLYDSLLKEEAFRKASHCLDTIVAGDLRHHQCPFDPAVWTKRLSLSFPRQVGVAIYDIERFDDRAFVGRVYGTEFKCGSGIRCGLLRVVLSDVPLDVVLKGSKLPQELEVVASGESLGLVQQSENSQTEYVIRSTDGEKVVELASSDIQLQYDEKLFRFALQLDLTPFPNLWSLFTRRVQNNPNVVFDPRIPHPESVLVMALVLSIRMIYRRHDF